jgi:hypothetical protein
VYPLAVAVHALWLAIVGLLIGVEGFETTMLALVLLYVVFLQVYALPDLSRASDRAEGLGRYWSAANVVAMALPLVGITLLLDVNPVFGLVGAVVVVIAGLLSGLTQYQHHRE